MPQFVNPYAIAADSLTNFLALREVEQRQAEDRARAVQQQEFENERRRRADVLSREQFEETKRAGEETRARLTEQTATLNAEREAQTAARTEAANAKKQQGVKRQELIGNLRLKTQAGDKEAARLLQYLEYQDATGENLPSGALNDPEEIARIRGDIAKEIAELRGRMSADSRGQMSATSEAVNIDRLAKAWEKANSAGRELERQFNIMETGLTRYNQDPNGASQAVLVTFQKMLDPTSVVRESEYARSAEGISALQRVQGWVERFGHGGAGVPPAVLKEMVETARQIKANGGFSTNGARRRIGAVADRYRIPHELVFTDMGPDTPAPQTQTQAPPAGGAATTTPPPAGGAPRVTIKSITEIK